MNQSKLLGKIKHKHKRKFAIFFPSLIGVYILNNLTKTLLPKNNTKYIKLLTFEQLQSKYREEVIRLMEDSIKHNLFDLKKLDEMGFLERLQYYRTITHLSKEIKKRIKDIRYLNFSIEDSILKGSESKYNLSSNLINEIVLTSEMYVTFLKEIRNSDNEFLVHYLLEEPSQSILQALNQILCNENNMNKELLHKLKSIAYDFHNLLDHNNIIQIEAEKLLTNIDNVDKNEKTFNKILYPINHSSLNKTGINIIYINGLNSIPLNSWRVQSNKEYYFSKTWPSLHSCYFKSTLNFIFNTNFVAIPMNLENKLTNQELIKLKNQIEDVNSSSYKKFKNLFQLRQRQFTNIWINTFFHDYLLEKNIKANHFIAGIETKKFRKELQGIPDMSISELANRLLTSLKLHNIENEKCIFVCHSMGGLVFKEMLKQGMNSENIKGVVFFSTPHYGSSIFNDIAKYFTEKLIPFYKMSDCFIQEYALEYKEIENNLNDFFTTIACDEICLKPKSYFNELNSIFISKKIPHFCINEKLKSFVFESNEYFWIVEPESMCPSRDSYASDEEYNNMQIFIKDKKHFDVNKFASKEDLGFKEFIKVFEKLI